MTVVVTYRFFVVVDFISFFGIIKMKKEERRITF